MMLLKSAKSGARGKAATKRVVKPNCKTETNTNRMSGPIVIQEKFIVATTNRYKTTLLFIYSHF